MPKRPIDSPEGNFNVSAGLGAGTVKDVARFDLVGASVHCRIASGTIAIQASNDNVDWQDVATGIATSQIVALSFNCNFLRIQTTVAPFDGSVTLFAHELTW